MLLESLVTRRVSEENVSKSSLTRRVTKQAYLLLAALVDEAQSWRFAKNQLRNSLTGMCASRSVWSNADFF